MLAVHNVYKLAELVASVPWPLVVPSDELRDATVQVLLPHLVVDAILSALEDSPEGFHTVRVYMAAHVLANTVVALSWSSATP